MQIIDRLNAFIQGSGLSVQDCAKEMGVSFATLYRLMNGTSDKSAILKIDAFLDRRNFYPQEKHTPTVSWEEE